MHTTRRGGGAAGRAARGQGLVEFALLAPLLVMLIIGLVELAILLNVYIGMTNSAREAARAGAIYQYGGAAPLSGSAGAAATIDAARQQYLSGVISDTLNPIVAATAVTVTTSYTPAVALASNPYRAGDTIAVQLVYEHQLFFGALGRRTLTIRASSAMRIEPGGTR